MKKSLLVGTIFTVILAVFFVSGSVTAQIKDVLATGTKHVTKPKVVKTAPFATIAMPVDPFFNEMEQEMNRVFNSFRTKVFSNGFTSSMPGMSIDMTTGRADVKQVGDNIIVTVDLPGHDKKSINLSIKDNNLIITSERKAQKTEKKGTYFRKEITYGKFSRIIGLPKKVLEDKITATYKDGVLTVVAPIDKSKPKANVGHKITVN